jgi:REP element-mobilizing transposase RayT
MPRRARIAIAGIPWHIIQRGNNRSACFFAEGNYRHFLDTQREEIAAMLSRRVPAGKSGRPRK